MTWYHAEIYNREKPVPSFWADDAPPLAGGVDHGPLSADLSCDVAIIGGGYTGLSAALHLARDFQTDVVLLEAGPLGWGASGRNGGFCSLPSMSLSYSQLISRYGAAEARRFMDTQCDAIDLVTELCETESIDIARQGHGTLHVAHAPSRAAELAEEAEFLKRHFGLTASLLTREEVAEQHYDSTEQFGALHLHKGFGLHPLRFARGLAEAAARHGAKLFGSSEVVSWEKSSGTHLLRTKGGTVKARRVIVATNGFTQPALSRELADRLMPVVSNIIVTRPLSEAECAAQKWQTRLPCSNTRNLLFYYRMLPDRRFLFGARGDLSGSPEAGDRRRAFMARRLGEVFPAWRDVEITHFWRGLVCMTGRLTPAIGTMPDDSSVSYALAYHGDGVAAAPWAGRQLAQLIGGKTSFDAIPAPYRGLPPRFPVPSLKRWYLGAALGYYWFQDKQSVFGHGNERS